MRLALSGAAPGAAELRRRRNEVNLPAVFGGSEEEEEVPVIADMLIGDGSLLLRRAPWWWSVHSLSALPAQQGGGWSFSCL
jgi:hypothetical protein